MIVFVIIILHFIVCHNYYKGEFMYGSYISSRMLNIFSYGSNFSQLPKRDNLHIKDKRPAPNLSVIRKFYCIIFSNDLSLVYSTLHFTVMHFFSIQQASSQSAQSFSFFIPQHSLHGNLLIPAFPRFDSNGQLDTSVS